jgi:hypothetical protein
MRAMRAVLHTPRAYLERILLLGRGEGGQQQLAWRS